MGKLALAAKITHVPSMYLSELPGPRHGTRQDAIDGHREIARRCRASGVDTLVVWAQGTPTAQMMSEKIEEIRKWARNNIKGVGAAVNHSALTGNGSRAIEI